MDRIDKIIAEEINKMVISESVLGDIRNLLKQYKSGSPNQSKEEKRKATVAIMRKRRVKSELYRN